MRCRISQEKAFKMIEWILFIGFAITAGWFAHGVLEQFFSLRTSFSQHEEQITEYPVVVMIFHERPAVEVNLTNVIITYGAGEADMFAAQKLEIGKNNLQNDEYNITVEVILESLENYDGNRAFRIIHKTPILEKKMAKGAINVYTKFEEKASTFSKMVFFHLTSLKNSPGFVDGIWKDGKPFQVNINQNNIMGYHLQPQMTNYIKETGKCQEESYYECIASQFDADEFTGCPNKCIPNVFSNMGKNYRSPFCQNDTNNEKCNANYIWEHDFGSNCKKSCSNLEYFGELEAIMPIESRKKTWKYYRLHYLIHMHFAMKVYDEYLIYDFITMIGSVGGTLGIILKFKCV